MDARVGDDKVAAVQREAEPEGIGVGNQDNGGESGVESQAGKRQYTSRTMKALPSLVQRVAETIERRGLFAGARRIGVAVSGGADSVCLLHVLRELGLPCLTVLHLDHRLRGAESAADAGFVADLASRLGLPLIAREASLPDAGNLEQNARAARLAFFRDCIASGTVDRVAVGHTRSDQAETVLFRLLRGSGTAGLAGVRSRTSDGVVRPLIEIGRAEVEQFLKNRGIEWREDSTNADRHFDRNRIRHDLLPRLARDWNPEIEAALARTADQAAADEEYWRAEIDRIAAGCLAVENGVALWKLGASHPDAVARRLARRAVELAKGDLRGVDFRHIEKVVRLARSTAGSGRVQLPGLDICRSFNQIRFGPPQLGSFRQPASIPGKVAIPGTNRVISLELIENSESSWDRDCVYNGEMGFADLGLRSWMPGDRYRPIGSSCIQKLKTLFELARIPSWERVGWPVLADGDAIVWTRRFGVAAEYAARPDSRTALRIREMEAT